VAVALQPPSSRSIRCTSGEVSVRTTGPASSTLSPSFSGPRRDRADHRRHGRLALLHLGLRPQRRRRARVGWSGVGLRIKGVSPTATAGREAVRRLLHEPFFLSDARRIAADIATLGSPVMGPGWSSSLRRRTHASSETSCRGSQLASCTRRGPAG
jgi:hypothetical protein